jgi:hypothetical protein
MRVPLRVGGTKTHYQVKASQLGKTVLRLD